MDLPNESDQLPDLFIYIIDITTKNKIGYIRFPG